MAGTRHNYALELRIIDSNQFSSASRMPVDLDLSDHLQSQCQQCVPVGNKTGTNCITLLLNNMSHANLELIPFKTY